MVARRVNQLVAVAVSVYAQVGLGALALRFALASGMRILATHLPHAIDGLAVEVVGAAR